MTESLAKTYWLAVGTVSAPEEFVEVINRFSTSPTALDHVCCVGRSDVMSSMSRSIDGRVGVRQEALSLVDNVEALPVLSTATPIVATRERLLSSKKGADTKPGIASRPEACWFTREQQAALLEQLHQEKVAIVVEAGAHREWAICTHALLQYSTSPVLGIVRSTRVPGGD